MLTDFRHLAAQLTYLSPGELQDVRRAYDFAVRVHASQTREDGTPYVNHSIAVAEIVAGWKADRDTVVASLLHDVLEDTEVKRDEIAENFGRHVSLLVEGATKFTQADLSPDLPLDRKIETLRKLFDVMRLDMRVMLIKLADRLHNVRTIGTLPSADRRKRFALETLNIYYKIAFHLGLRTVRRELAELCVPHAFDCGAEDMAVRDRMSVAARGLFGGLHHELLGTDAKDRILKVYQLSRNLLIFHNRRVERGGQPLLEDAFSVNIVVREEEDCYYLLKILHTLHRPVSGRFRDYIAAPSDAGYRSLHTHVALSDGSVVEVRIRTPEMEEQALKGVALLLFGGGAKDISHFSWLQKSESIDLNTRDSSSAFWEALESDILRETVSVTVDRRRLSLPKGATALDAAYAVYNGRASHAKVLTVNGRAVQIGEQLKEDDEVHVTFDTERQATFDWLQSVCTHHARFLIVDVLKQSSRSEKIALGASLLQKEMDHYNKGLLSGLSRTQCQHVADHFKRQHFDEVLSMIGEGVIRARDVVFYLYPDHQRRSLLSMSKRRYRFRLHVQVTLGSGQDVLSHLNGVIRLSDVLVENVQVKSSESGMTDIHLTGSCEDRLHFADFIDALERQEWVSDVFTILSNGQKAFIASLFAVAFGVIVTDLVLLGSYGDALLRLSSTALILAFVIPLLPILLANYYILSYLRAYIFRLRRERWYFGLGFFLNMLGIVLVTWKLPLLRTGSAVLIILSLFAVAMLLLGYRFAETYLLLDSARQSAARDSVKLRTKVIGYLLRFGAVFIWGIEPVLIRYTPLQQLSPLLRVNIWAVAGAVSGFGAIALLNLFRSKKDRLAYTTPYNRYFWIIVIANLSYNYFLHRSLLFTTATNVNLVLSYAPVFALLLGFIIWKDRIAYFRSAHSIQQMFLVFALSALGGTLLIYNDTYYATAGALGDLYALFIAFSDVAFIMSNIHYVKYSNKATNTISLATHHFLWIAVLTFLLIGVANLGGASISFSITPTQWLSGITVGVLTLIGLVLTFEAFRRIDGLLAFLMLNLAPFIAFVAEVLFVDRSMFSPLFLLGGCAIVSASIFAEVINSRCQKSSFQ